MSGDAIATRGYYAPAVAAVEEDEDEPTPVLATDFEIGDPATVDHFEDSIARLCDQFKSDDEED